MERDVSGLRRYGRLALATAAALLLAVQRADADGLQAGLYRIEQSPVVDGIAAPVQRSTRCLTAEAVADLDKTFSPVSRTTNSACERTEHDLTPQRLKWRLQCTGQLNMDVAGEFVFDTDRYTATLSTEASMAGQVMHRSRVTIEAQRVGDCP
jgi:Protein of unknown function (DUF3617)